MGTDDDQTRTATATEAGSDPALETTVESGNSPSMGPADSLRVPVRIGRYQIIDVLGSGGMGVVYRARDPDLGRELAIKVVRHSSGMSRAQERLVDEARAMATLRHPAVVPVFDVGVAADGVFIVMPLLRGGTLHDWMRERRPWRQVLDRLLAAGRGLAAAHAAGLVHRDFKPRNVLIGDSGDVLVADFGIAARTDDSIDRERASSTPGTAQVSSIAGTPAYMAPEQADGGSIDARADQYSFSICLWEALCGERPGEAETNTRTSISVPGAPMAAGGRRGVPAWLLAAVRRGYSASPQHRWSSMEELLGHIEARLRRPRRIAAAVAIVTLAGAAAGAVLVIPGGGRDPCPDPVRRLADVWTTTIGDKIAAAFAASGLPYAEDTAARVVSTLDDYATIWRTKKIEACKAAKVERVQSAVLFERRDHCLDRRLAVLAGHTRAFRDPDPAVVAGALATIERLPRLDECDDAEALLAYTSPVAPLLRPRIVELDHRLDDLHELESRGRIAERLATSASIAATTRRLGYPPLHARALRAHLSALRDDGEPSEKILRELVQSAAEARDDALVVYAWTSLIEEFSVREHKLTEAKALEAVAVAALVRARSPPEAAFRLAMVRARRAMAAHELEPALAHASNALELAPTPALRSEAHATLAAWLASTGRLADAQHHAEAALREILEARGALHPDTATRAQALDDIRRSIAPDQR